MTQHHRPIWDRGEAIDPEMLAYTIGDDWLQDQRLVEHDIAGSLAHVAGLVHAGLLDDEAGARITQGLKELLAEYQAGSWQLTPADEDVHSAIERLLTDKIGEDGGRMHLGRSRNDQVTVDVRLWLRAAAAETTAATESLLDAMQALESQHGALPLPGYTHLRRAMPSSVGDWLAAHRVGLAADLEALQDAAKRWRLCPLGSGSGYGIPLPLDRAFVAEQLGFDGPEEPVTAVQHGRGRPELAYLTALENMALTMGKLASDLWLYSTAEFSFVVLPTEFTTGSSLMPQKRNPDLIELLRAQCRQVVVDRAALLAVIQDLPSGYHRDFQLIKPPLFRGHDRALASLRIVARFVPALRFDTDALQAAAADPDLAKTAQALQAAAQGGQTFRAAYREEASSSS